MIIIMNYTWIFYVNIFLFSELYFTMLYFELLLCASISDFLTHFLLCAQNQNFIGISLLVDPYFLCIGIKTYFC